MYGKLKEFLTNELEGIKAAGLYKNERIITTPQRADIKVNAGSDVLNFCANNYLGLSNDPRLIEAAKASYDRWGFGLSSVRFICGTQEIHKELERRIANFVGTDDAILYSSCFDANGGLFETLLNRRPKQFGDLSRIITGVLNQYYDNENVILVQSKNLRFTFEEPVAWTRDGEAGGVTTDVTLRNNHAAIHIIA